MTCKTHKKVKTLQFEYASKPQCKQMQDELVIRSILYHCYMRKNKK